ncbi:MAG: DUF3800 domain-containing protein [Nanoarchaeota archaeon]|nr:DUF3800 domain-containing protein [Nanoarchaeota archaeon]
MAVYNLYLDESATHTFHKNVYFSIAGIIIEDEYYNDVLSNNFDQLKKNIWGGDYPTTYNDLILHEKDIKEALNPRNIKNLHKLSPEYHRFSDFKNAKLVYTELDKIIRSSKITVLGGCINEDNLDNHYHADLRTDSILILMQIILENFCHFLKANNGTGRIFYESVGSSEDKIISTRFHHIKAMGTMYVSPYAMQCLIKDISFPKKNANVIGLQIADFIPNNIARFVANKTKNSLNLYNSINKAKYTGGLNKPEKYGIKLIP